MRVKYYLCKMTNDGPYIMTGRDGLPLEFRDRITVAKIVEGLNSAGAHCFLVEFDPRAEVLNIPLDNFGMSSGEPAPAPQGGAGRGCRNDPGKVCCCGGAR